MPCYFFNLKDGRRTIRDPDGTEFPDDSAARDHATRVARELMKNTESRTRAWRINVCDGDGMTRFELLFASIDDSIAHLSPDLRSSVEDVCGKTASLSDTINQVQTTLLQVRGTLAQAERAPYLAVLNGVRIV
jgi:hypothetical protein